MTETESRNDTLYDMVIPNRDAETWEAFRDLFPDDCDFYGWKGLLFGAVDREGRAVAGCAIDINPDLYTIDWFYVHPQARRQGAGTFLMQKIFDYMEAAGSYRDLEMEFTSSEFEMEAFLLSLGTFDIERYAFECRAKVSGMADGALAARLTKIRPETDLFMEMKEQDRQKTVQYLTDLGYLTVMDQKAWESQLEQELCFCRYENGNLTGAAFFRRLGDRELELFLLYAETQKAVREILASVSIALLKKYGDYDILMTPINSASRKLMDAFAGDVEEVGAKYRASWNYS